MFLSWWQILIYIITPVIISILYVRRWRKKRGNVFLTPIISDPPRMNDLDEDELIKKPFSIGAENELKDYINNPKKKFDAIIVGSGITGLTAASLLSQSGKSVLVLEQGEQLGGWIHDFEEDGFRFIPGINYLPKLHDGSLHKVIFDKISEGLIKFKDYGELIDTVILNDKKIEVRRDGLFKDYLLEHFPDEKKGIDKYFQLMKKIMRQQVNIVVVRSSPSYLRWLMKLFFPCSDWLKLNDISMKELMDQLFESEELKVLAGYMVFHLGDYSSPASIGMMVSGTYLLYGSILPTPKGCMPRKIARVIHKFKGKMFCNAKVSELIVKGKKRVIGVRVGEQKDSIFGEKIITTCGLENTFRLLPKTLTPKDFSKFISPSESLFYVFCGFDVPYEELEFPKSHVLVLSDLEEDQLGMLISCKNHVHENSKGCQVMIISPMEYSKVENWESSKLKQRGTDYEEIKNIECTKLLDILYKYYPKAEDHLVHCSTGTGLSVRHYVGWERGETTGAKLSKHTLFTNYDKFIKNHGIKNLVISGTDSFFCGGVYAGCTTGIVAAGEVSGIDYIGDAVEAMSARKEVFKMIK